MDYYTKYIKYKIKYLNLLKQQGGEHIDNLDQDDYEDLKKALHAFYLLFTEQKLCEMMTLKEIEESQLKETSSTPLPEEITIIEEKLKKTNLEETNPSIPPKTPKRIRKPRTEENMIYGRYTDEIIRYLDTKEPQTNIKELLKGFNKDDEENYKLLLREEEFFLTDQNAKLIECWIADNMSCPCCDQQTLRRYENNFMPIIDLVCINPAHTIKDGVKFFQIKTQNKSDPSTFFQRFTPYDQYFGTVDEHKYAHTGSKRFGKFIHNITTDSEFADLLIGYIFVYYRQDEDKIKISKDSYIIRPKIYETIINPKPISRNLFSQYTPETSIKLSKPKKPQKRNYSIRSEDLENPNLENPELKKSTDPNEKKYYWYLNNNMDNKILLFSNINNDINSLFHSSISFDTSYIGTKYKIIDNPIKNFL